MDMIGWKGTYSLMVDVLYLMRETMSARMHRSRMSGVASRESSHVLCITIVFVPPMKISDVYSSIARFESATAGTYLMTTTWSGCSCGLYRIRLDMTMSSTTFDLEISFERNVCGAERFLPSLLPRWLYETIEVGLRPAETRKSTITDFIFVWPDLKSSPPIITSCFSASSMTPGTKVFWGEPLIYIEPSRMEATAKTVEGAISASLASIDAIRLSAVSLTPDWTAAKRSVLAVQSKMTLSRPFFDLNSRMSLRICSR
mmetsp:Transcript_21233/g.36381  ORF Transcript_21233/g.36381 Transcript_21233/m.36381 type:complete len:258 (+) Transcript_21233:808-1581(+)